MEDGTPTAGQGERQAEYSREAVGLGAAPKVSNTFLLRTGQWDGVYGIIVWYADCAFRGSRSCSGFSKAKNQEGAPPSLTGETPWL
jgi:hypothetical protein